MVEGLPPGDLNVADGQSVTVEIRDSKDVVRGVNARGGQQWTLMVYREGKPWFLKGGKRLWDALYPVLLAAPTYPVRVTLTAKGTAGSLDRTWSCVPA